MNRFLRGALFLAPAAVLCAPSLSWALGEQEYRTFAVAVMAAVVVFAPAILIFFLKKWWQCALLLLLLALFLWEQMGGVTITIQLNHEGSDLAFSLIRVTAFLVFLVGLELGFSKRSADA